MSPDIELPTKACHTIPATLVPGRKREFDKSTNLLYLPTYLRISHLCTTRVWKRDERVGSGRLFDDDNPGVFGVLGRFEVYRDTAGLG